MRFLRWHVVRGSGYGRSCLGSRFRRKGGFCRSRILRPSSALLATGTGNSMSDGHEGGRGVVSCRQDCLGSTIERRVEGDCRVRYLGSN